MSPFVCNHCGIELKNRFHKCGIKEDISHVEIFNGGGNWGCIIGAGIEDRNNE